MNTHYLPDTPTLTAGIAQAETALSSPIPGIIIWSLSTTPRGSDFLLSWCKADDDGGCGPYDDDGEKS